MPLANLRSAGCCHPGAGASAAKAERRVRDRGMSASHAATRMKFSAAAINRWSKRVFTSPIYRERRRSLVRVPCEIVPSMPAGIEGTLSQGTRAFELRRSRYLGEAKTHLQHPATAAAINLVRLFAWFEECPRESRRISPFAALAPAG
jgi:hypothetical protein